MKFFSLAVMILYISLIDDIEKKFVLFMGHKVRVVNQHQRIKALHNQMKDVCVNTKGIKVIALLCIDWKMKWEAFSNRETIMKHYGKRGVSWHGVYILYYIWLEDKAVKQRVYLDQILNGDNKQDGLSVLSMIEAMIVHIKEDLAFIKELWLQSNNAGCYHLKDLVSRN